MRVLIVGCGAIGSYYACKLSHAGIHVTVTARHAHLEAIQTNGLHVQHDGQSFHAALPAYDHDYLLQHHQADDFDVIILALKSNLTEHFIEQFRRWLSVAKVPVLSVQNGVDNEIMLAAVLGEVRVWGGLAVKIGGEVMSPGNAVTTGIAKLIIGPWPTAATSPIPGLMTQFQRALQRVNVPCEIADNIQRELWKKLIINNGVNPLSALTGLDTRTLTNTPKFSNRVYLAMRETVQAARFDNVELQQQELDDMFELIKHFNAIKTSMLIDREKGRPLEVEAIVGAVVKRCDKLGVDAPVNQALYKALEAYI